MTESGQVLQEMYSYTAEQGMVICNTHDREERVQTPVEKCFQAPSKSRLAKNLYAKSERLTLSCRVTWAWSERANLYNQQIIILPRKTKTYAT